MALIARRKTTQTWRDAVLARAEPDAKACLSLFDEMVGSGHRDAEAAYRALAAFGLLWDIPGPEGPPRPADAAEQGRPHRVPNV